MREVRGCWSRYFLTVFLDSPTSTARTITPFSRYSWLILSTKPASSRQNPHQVVQNSKRTTFPLTEMFVNFSPSVVLALNRGPGSLFPGLAGACRVAKSDAKVREPAAMSFLADMREIYHKSSGLEINKSTRS